MNKLLRIAIQIKNLDLVKMHIQNGVNLEEQDNDGRTALLLAADVGACEIFRYLLYNGANDNIYDKQGLSLFEHLKKSNHSEILSIYEIFRNEQQESDAHSTLQEKNPNEDFDTIEWEPEPEIRSFEDNDNIHKEVAVFEKSISSFSVSDQAGSKDNATWLDEEIIKEIESNHQTGGKFIPEFDQTDLDYLKAFLAFAQDYQTVPAEFIDNLTLRFNQYHINTKQILYDYLSYMDVNIDIDMPDELINSARKRFRVYLLDVDKLEFDAEQIIDNLKQELTFTNNTELFRLDVSRISKEALAPLRHKAKSFLDSICQYILDMPILWKIYWNTINSQFTVFQQNKKPSDSESEDKSEMSLLHSIFREKDFIKKYRDLFQNGENNRCSDNPGNPKKIQLLNDTVYSFRLAIHFLNKFIDYFNQQEDISYQDAVISNNLYTLIEYLERLRKRIIHSQLQNTLNHSLKLYVDNGIDDESDIIQEGMEGLIKAVDRYDFRQKTQLMSYATFWINQMIQRRWTDLSLVKIPVYVQEEYRAQLKSSFDQENIFIPQVKQLEIDGERAVVFDPETNLKYDISDMFTYTNFRLSSSEYEELKDLTGQLVKSLSPRHRSIIQKRYGLGKEIPFTLEQLASVLALTRERVRQLESRSIEHLRDEILKHGEIIVYGDQ